MSENPKIKLDENKVELLIKASKFKSFKVTSTLLNKTKRFSVEDLLPKAAVPSTSRNKSVTPEPVLRRGQKRRGAAFDENSRSEKENKCAKCGGRLLRVVDNGRPDKRLVLECMRRDCLATLNFTTLPVGTVLGAETFSPNGYYRDPVRMYYPSELEINQSIEDTKNEDTSIYTSFLDNDRGTFLISVPGQVQKSRLL